MNKKSIFGTAISVGSYTSFVAEILRLSERESGSYVCFANVHMIVEAYRDSRFQKIVNDANVTAPDGRPLSLFLKFFERIKQDRVCGMDILPDLLKHAEMHAKSVYFYGTTNELLHLIVQKARIEFPLLKIVGHCAPPFRPLSRQEDEAITGEINRVQPNLIFVSLGCPKQERWMAEHKEKINACFLGVGQAFRVYAGVERRLPKWLRNLSMEWLYRLFLEPRRLWRRYLFTNSFFLYLVVRHLFFRFQNKTKQGDVNTCLE